MSIINTLQYEVEQLKDKLYNLEKERGSIPKSLTPFNRAIKASARTAGRAWAPLPLYGIHLGVCVDTRDPWKMGRITVYCPVVHNLKTASYLTETSLPWARPCSAFGAIDDMGSIFIPPEGSVVLILFEAGHREAPFYIGSTWIPKKSDASKDESDFTPEREISRWSSGKRNSDIKTGETNSLFPPWNNESYYGEDLQVKQGGQSILANNTRNLQLYTDLDEEKKGKYGEGYSTKGWRSFDTPHIYGIKTPEKHMIQFDDGSYDRENKLWGKRLVVQSSKGSFIIMKDDADQTAEEIYKHKFWDSKNDNVSVGNEPFDKPANKHTIELNHTGVQIQSFGGGRLIIDDKIQGNLKPNGVNEWNSTFPPIPEKGIRLWRTMTRLESHTEHRITLSDHHEDKEFQRSSNDGIFLSSACGHYMGMIDHTDNTGKAGSNRKIHIQSTSGHKIELKDNKCTVKSPTIRSNARYSGKNQRDYRDNFIYDSPKSMSNGQDLGEKVCLKITSGFGHYLLFEDGSKQDKVTEQFLILSNAPGWNEPHNFLKMNQSSGNKLVHLNCAGERLTTVESNYLRYTKQSETLISNQNQIHIVEKGNMIDAVLEQNLVQYVKLQNHVIFCRHGSHVTYALRNTAHLSLIGPHVILGGVPPEGGKPPDGAAPVLLYGGEAPLNAHVSKWLIAN